MEKNTSLFEKRLLVSACALIVLAWSLFIADQWVTHENRIKSNANRAASLALAVEQRIERSVRVVDQMLLLVRNEINKQGVWQDKSALTRILERHIPNLDEVYAVAFVAPDSIALALSTPEIEPGRSHTDRDFYRFHLADRKDTLYIEKPFALASSGKGVFTLSRPLRNERGELLGIVLTVVRTDILAKEFDALRIGSNGSIGLHHIASYRIIARQPLYEETASRNIVHENLLQALEKAPIGNFNGSISEDNEKRFFAYRKINDLPLAVTVGVSHDDIVDELEHDLTGHLITMLFLTFLVGVGTAFLLRTHRKETVLKGLLNEKSALLETFFDAIPAGIATIDKGLRYQLINPKMAEINGKVISDYVGRSVSEVHSSLAGKIAPYHQGVFSSGQSYGDIEFSGKRADSAGSPGSWLATFFPIRDKAGAVSMMGCFVVDITEQKRIEDKLRHNELLLSTVLDALPVGVRIADRDGRIIRSNPASERIWAGKLEVAPERYGEYKGWWVETGERVASEDWALARAVLKGEDTVGDLVDIECFDGSRKTIINSALTLRSSHGVALGAIVVIEDITNIRRAQEELRVSRDFFEKIFNDAPVGIAIADKEGHFIKVNHAMARFTGYSEDELLSMTYMDIGHPEDTEINVRLRQDLLSGKSAAVQAEKRYLRKDGSSVWGLAIASAISDKDGNPVQAIGQVLDIDRQKKIELALKDSRKKLRALSARQTQLLEEDRKRIAQEIHDELGQLLTAIKMDVALLRINFGDNPKLQEKVEQMRQLIDRTIVVVRHVASNLRPAALDLGLLPALEWLAADFSARSAIPCSFEADQGDLPLDDTVSTTIFRATQESLTNIARHADAGKVSISLKYSMGILSLCVRDDGRGFDMPLEDPQKGLGFFGMRERVHAAGGHLDIESAPGKGTTISIILPVKGELHQ